MGGEPLPRAGRARSPAAVAGPRSASYAWFGRRRRRARPCPRAPRPELAGALYRSFYTQGMPVPSAGRRVRRLPIRGSSTRCRAPTPGAVAGRPAGAWAVADAPQWEAPRRACRDPRRRPPTAAAARCTVSVRRLEEHRAASPGFYTALGDAEPRERRRRRARGAGVLPPHRRRGRTARRPLHAPAQCRGSAVRPQGRRPPDGLRPRRRGRAVPRRAATSCASSGVRALAPACRPHLRDEVPAFTRPLAPGVAVGEHLPRLGASFGSTRCRLLAEAIVDAHGLGLDARLDTVRRRFEVAGLDLDRPYLARPAAGDGHVL